MEKKLKTDFDKLLVSSTFSIQEIENKRESLNHFLKNENIMNLSHIKDFLN